MTRHSPAAAPAPIMTTPRTKPPAYDGPERRAAEPRPHLRFDPTINLGHVLTFVGFIVSGFMAWSTLDKRLTIEEQSTLHQAERDAAYSSALRDMRTELSETRRSLDDLRMMLARQPQGRQP